MKAKIFFTVETDVQCTQEQFEEWLNYAVFEHTSSISVKNPLHSEDFDFNQSINNSIDYDEFEYEIINK